MNQNLIHQAQELQKKGYSIRQIASELNVSKSQVFRWLNRQSGNGGNEYSGAKYTTYSGVKGATYSG